MKNFNDEPRRSQQPEQNGAEHQNPPKFDNKPLVVKDYNIIVFFIYNLFFAPLAVPVFLYIGDIFPLYAVCFRSIRRHIVSKQRPYAPCAFDEQEYQLRK